VRRILDDAGCGAAKIVASGDLNEARIAELRRAGAPIDVYGVGTDLVTSIDAPSLGGVYKLVEISGVEPGAGGGGEGERTPIAKFSEGKATLPGAHQVHRFRDPGGKLARDVIALASEPVHPEAEPLLAPVMERGARVAPPEELDAVRARAGRQISALPDALRRIDDVASARAPFEVEVSPRLAALVEVVRARVAPGAEERRGREAGDHDEPRG
jgi:nicotinate phosphoribosyltransferase